VYRIWTGVECWHVWDPDEELVALEGPFAVGTEGCIVPAQGFGVPLVPTECTEDRSFTVVVRIPMFRMHLEHTLEAHAEQSPQRSRVDSPRFGRWWVEDHSMQVTGRCHCGAISFRALVDPSRVIACHCEDCQEFSGAPFRAVAPVPVADVALVGHPKLYLKVAASGTRRAQAFCPECGTQLCATEADEPRVLNLRLGCIDQRARLPPQVQMWGRSAMAYLVDLPRIPMHDQGRDSALLASCLNKGSPDATALR
jgi:hypothetical protein